jgi:hypothetical protein
MPHTTRSTPPPRTRTNVAHAIVTESDEIVAWTSDHHVVRRFGVCVAEFVVARAAVEPATGNELVVPRAAEGDTLVFAVHEVFSTAAV